MDICIFGSLLRNTAGFGFGGGSGSGVPAFMKPKASPFGFQSNGPSLPQTPFGGPPSPQWPLSGGVGMKGSRGVATSEVTENIVFDSFLGPSELLAKLRSDKGALLGAEIAADLESILQSTFNETVPSALKRLTTHGAFSVQYRISRFRGSSAHYLSRIMRHLLAQSLGREDEIQALTSYVDKIKQIDEECDGEGICSPMEGLKETNYYFIKQGMAAAATGTANMRAIMKELCKELPAKLTVDARGSMFVRYDAESPQFLRAVLTGIDGSPYSR
jgi:hypothetical protein